jgi:hypothetical protein
LIDTKIETIWIRELDDLLETLDEVEEDEENDRKKALGKKGG